MSDKRCDRCANLHEYCRCDVPAAAAPEPTPDTWEQFETLAEWVEAGYSWTAVALFRRTRDGALFIAEDAGCSCFYAWERDPADYFSDPIQNDSAGWAVIAEAAGGIDPADEQTRFLRDAAKALAAEWRAGLTADHPAPSPSPSESQ
jgi:hypothetical protein